MQFEVDGRGAAVDLDQLFNMTERNFDKNGLMLRIR